MIFRLLQILHVSLAFHPPAVWLVSRLSDTAVPKVASDLLVAKSSGHVLNHVILNILAAFYNVALPSCL